MLKWFTQEITVSYSDAKKKMPERVGNMVDFYSTRLVQYYPEGNMPAEIIGTDEELPTQTPMNMIRYAPVSTAGMRDFTGCAKSNGCVRRFKWYCSLPMPTST